MGKVLSRYWEGRKNFVVLLVCKIIRGETWKPFQLAREIAEMHNKKTSLDQTIQSPLAKKMTREGDKCTWSIALLRMPGIGTLS